tara:strand:+ start:2250 stop:3158 length:909 start_codon:yes stop_codon:yes gene_type:complete
VVNLLSDFKNEIVCISCQFLRGVGAVRARKVLNQLSLGNNSIIDYVDAVNQSLPIKSHINQETAYNVLRESQELFLKCNEENITVLPITDDGYPIKLTRIPDPPPVLWVKGDMGSLDSISSIAVVGTRNPTDKGGICCERITRVLTEKGSVIVSGLAVGCDAIAHRSCLREGGKTVAVLPSGVDIVTPEKHQNLAKSIMRNGGVLLSEYAPGTKARRSSFIQRNRVQSSLSDAVVIIQAGAKSGTMETAKFCIAQKRSLYCVDAAILEKGSESEGNRILIGQGATPLIDKESVLSVLTVSSF